MPPKLCRVCGQWLCSAEEAWQKHLLSNAHQKRLHQATVQKNQEKNGIFVTGFHGIPDPLDKLHSHFEQFGEIANGFLSKDGNYAILEFKESKSAEEALKKRCFIGGRQLIVRPRKSRSDAHRKAEPLPPAAEVDLKVEEVGSWEDQVHELMAKLGISTNPFTAWEDRRLRTICSAVQRVLSAKFQRCQCYIFGSAFTGLAGPDSDVDIYVDLSPSLQFMSPALQSLLESDPPAFHASLFKQCLREMQRSSEFSHLMGIPRARTPVIKCVHHASKTQCDVVFRNGLAVCNSDMLKYYYDLDPRIKMMCVVLKFWSKQCSFSSLSTYAISMMAIMYLTSLQPPLGPTPQELITASTQPCYNDGWRCNFERIPFQSCNTMNLQELLQGFFQFLSRYDFGVNVMCVLLGQSLPKWIFVQPETLPSGLFMLQDAMDKGFSLKVETLMCVQDPFELDHNTTRAVVDRVLNELVEAARWLAEYCAKEESTLNGLMQYKPQLPAATEIAQSPFQLVIPLRHYYPSNLEEVKQRGMVAMWQEKVTRVLRDIWEHVLGFELEVKDLGSQGPPHKIQKVEPLPERYSGQYQLWAGRQRAIKDIDTSKLTSHLGKEIALSMYLKQACYPPGLQLKQCVSVTVRKSFLPEPTRLELEVEDTGSDKVCFMYVCRFLRAQLPVLVKKAIDMDYDQDMQHLRENGVTRAAPPSVKATKEEAKNAPNSTVEGSPSTPLLGSGSLANSKDELLGSGSLADSTEVLVGSGSLADSTEVLVGSGSLADSTEVLLGSGSLASSKEALLGSSLADLSSSESSPDESDQTGPQTKAEPSKKKTKKRLRKKKKRSPVREEVASSAQSMLMGALCKKLDACHPPSSTSSD